MVEQWNAYVKGKRHRKEGGSQDDALRERTTWRRILKKRTRKTSFGSGPPGFEGQEPQRSRQELKKRSKGKSGKEKTGKIKFYLREKGRGSEGKQHSRGGETLGKNAVGVT